MGFTGIGECIIAAIGSCTVILTGHEIPKHADRVTCLTSAVQFPVRPMHCVLDGKRVIVHGTPGTLHSVIIEVRRHGRG